MPDLSLQQEDQIRKLIEQRNMIAAIKLYREETGVGLKEAKDAVEAIERGEPVMASISAHVNIRNDALLDEQIKHFLVRRKKIEAVRVYREAHNCGLKDAKDAVDIIEVEMRKETHTSLSSGNDPFAEDKQRNRTILIFVLAFALLVIGGLVFLFIGTGF